MSLTEQASLAALSRHSRKSFKIILLKINLIRIVTLNRYVSVYSLIIKHYRTHNPLVFNSWFIWSSMTQSLGFHHRSPVYDDGDYALLHL